jgi:tetratricopeptide (TPR) repeat protein
MHKQAAKTQQALSLFQQGNLTAAQSLLEKICPKDKKNDLAWFLLASIHFQNNRFTKAKQLYQAALKANPKYAEAWNNLGVAEERLGNLGAAKTAYSKALTIRPRYSNALFHLGYLHQQQQNYDQAQSLFEQVLAIEPGHIKALNNLAVTFEKLSEYDKALGILQHSLTISPDDVDVLNNLGQVLNRLERYEEAIPFLQKAIAIAPKAIVSYNHLGNSFLGLTQTEKSQACFLHILSLSPTNAGAMCNLARCLEQQGQIDQAMALYQDALTIEPELALAHNGVGVLLRRKGEPQQACNSFHKALSIKPDFFDARFNLATTQLGLGNFCQGFSNYLARPSRTAITTSLSELNPNLDLYGKRILIIKDQGIGDELFFLRFLPALKRRGAYIYYLADNKTRSIIQHLQEIDCLLDEKEIPNDVDFTCLVGDLPALIAADRAAPPLALMVDPSLKAELQTTLASLGPPPYIGLTWRGGINNRRRLFKEINTGLLADTMKSCNATFIALQRNPIAGEITQLSSHLSRAVHDLSALNNDLPRMLAVLSLLDDYVGVSNTNMHLMAGIGGSARVLIPHPPEWRWQHSGKQSPWFPGFQLYRQDSDGHWQDVIRELTQDLDTVCMA